MTPITPIYAGLLGLMLVFLSLRVVQRRRAAGVSVGDGNDRDLIKRMRVQANLTEYAPLGLILLWMAEVQGMPGWLVHAFGLTLVTGRLLHAVGFGATPQIPLLRTFGMALTLGTIATLGLSSIAHGVF